MVERIDTAHKAESMRRPNLLREQAFLGAREDLLKTGTDEASREKSGQSNKSLIS